MEKKKKDPARLNLTLKRKWRTPEMHLAFTRVVS